jgi:MFS family permease
MVTQGAALFSIGLASEFWAWLGGAALLGVGTAMVYPTLLAAVADVTPPWRRGSAVGMYRFWRDSGYVVGALLAGTLADRFGMSSCILAIGVLTVASGLLVAARMPETFPVKEGHRD